MSFLVMFWTFGVVGLCLWFTALAAMYLAFTTSYLLCVLGWQAWKKGKVLWKRI